MWGWMTDLRMLRGAWRRVAMNKGKRSGIDGMTVGRILATVGEQSFLKSFRPNCAPAPIGQAHHDASSSPRTQGRETRTIPTSVGRIYAIFQSLASAPRDWPARCVRGRSADLRSTPPGDHRGAGAWWSASRLSSGGMTLRINVFAPHSSRDCPTIVIHRRCASQGPVRLRQLVSGLLHKHRSLLERLDDWGRECRHTFIATASAEGRLSTLVKVPVADGNSLRAACD
jgi:hypothetical protein